jgi:hypothetical protein
MTPFCDIFFNISRPIDWHHCDFCHLDIPLRVPDHEDPDKGNKAGQQWLIDYMGNRRIILQLNPDHAYMRASQACLLRQRARCMRG